MMKLWKGSLGLAVMIGALVAANDGPAQTREPIIKARVEISLTDPDTNNVLYAYRLSRLFEIQSPASRTRQYEPAPRPAIRPRSGKKFLRNCQF